MAFKGSCFFVRYNINEKDSNAKESVGDVDCSGLDMDVKKVDEKDIYPLKSTWG